MNKKEFLPSILVIVLAVFTACGTAAAQSKAEKIDTFMKQCHEYRLFNGTVLVAEGNKVIYKKSFGPANREWDVPNTPDTKYIIGSISKQFTAMLTLQLVEGGKLRLDGTISEYLPDFPKDKGTKITLHHLLTHTSGIPSNAKVKNWHTEIWLREHSTQELIEYFYDMDLEFEPGEDWEYCNPGYYILAAIIERVTDKKYEKVLEEKIFKSVGMSDSGFYDHYEILPGMAYPYEYWNFRFSKSEFSSPTTSKGAGSIYSTAGDLFKWDQALYSDKLLSKKYRELFFEPHMSIGPSVSYAYGWVAGQYDNPNSGSQGRYVEHSGGQPGYNCLIHRMVDDRHCILLFNNTGHTDLRVMQRGLRDILLGGNSSVKRPISLILNECRDLNAIKAAIGEFESSPYLYRIRRDAVNGLGFRMMLEEKYDSGITILEFNRRRHPNVHFVYESLGEAYSMAGNTEKAIENLERVLEMIPGNQWAKDKIKKLSKK
ncbi:serine hydrolase [Acidobacteriota bacterium]